MNPADLHPAVSTPSLLPARSSPTRTERVETLVTLGLQVVILLAFMLLPFLFPAPETQISSNSLVPLPARLTAYLIGWLFAGSGVLVLALTRAGASGRAFAILTATAGFSIAASLFLAQASWIAIAWGLAIAIAGGALVHLTLVFPQESTVENSGLIRGLVYLPGLLLAILSTYNLLNNPGAGSLTLLLGAGMVYGAFMITFALIRMGILWARSNSPFVRTQARLVLLGIGGAIAVPLGLALLSQWRPGFRADAILVYIPLGVFPPVVAYAILYYEKLGSQYLLSRAAAYASLTLLILLSYALLVAGASILFSGLTPWSASVLIAVLALLLAFGLNPLRGVLQSFVDQVFYRSQKITRQRLQDYSQALTRALDLPAIVSLTHSYIQTDLAPEILHIFIQDSMSDLYEAAPAPDGNQTTEVRFPASSVIVRQLNQHKLPIFLGGHDTLPTPMQAERARLALLGAQLFIPMHGQQQLIGWIALGPRRSGDAYGDIDVRYLDAIGDLAALAIERAQVIANLERRVHETDVLTRVAQGINITVRFDDILELIYAQTNHIIPCKDFQITLIDSNNPENIYHAFYLVDDERLVEEENVPLIPGKGLASEVIRKGTAIRTDDYMRECRARGALPSREGINAWMSIPLNAGAEVIGAIGIGSRDPTVVYSKRQAELLQAIADQAAGAIVKARLLDESERRTRQLATINEIGRSLTSTLDIGPLLNQILNSATEILNCEAGTLFSVDDENGDLIFEVTVGPVAADLAGKRIPAGTGIVGKAVEQREPILANDVQQTTAWSDSSDRETGFVTRDILVVPMIFKGHVTGVIEVINKEDGSPFDQEDLDLLATFSNQAAIATENARLYTQTDEALTARLEEMSVLQRIDRELNTSLDLERTMRISLDWAMQQSGAEAGMIGELEHLEGGSASLNVMAQVGYTHLTTLDETESGFSKAGAEQRIALPAHITEAIERGQARLLDAPQASSEQGVTAPGLLEDGRCALIVPIRRQAETIAILLLEATREAVFGEATLTFLSRLSDHAAIAITNARLYADLRAANVAKSEYVSLVSHELKTPMTSIRGYTDLLSQGVVGEINEAQANFLATIRSNVGRMATLVSDLADVSRIEADRLRLEFSAVDIRQVIEEVVRSQAAQIDEKSQSLQNDISEDLPAVWGDQNRLIQILTNLVSNANKYTPRDGTIEIHAEVSDNHWDPEGAPQVVHVSVKDNGYGISQADQEKIFQKFFRSEAQDIRDAPGTGLGLNITRHLVEMQGGVIWFESELGKGSNFQFTIPVTATG